MGGDLQFARRTNACGGAAGSSPNRTAGSLLASSPLPTLIATRFPLAPAGCCAAYASIIRRSSAGNPVRASSLGQLLLRTNHATSSASKASPPTNRASTSSPSGPTSTK